MATIISLGVCWDQTIRSARYCHLVNEWMDEWMNKKSLSYAEDQQNNFVKGGKRFFLILRTVVTSCVLALLGP